MFLPVHLQPHLPLLSVLCSPSAQPSPTTANCSTAVNNCSTAVNKLLICRPQLLLVRLQKQLVKRKSAKLSFITVTEIVVKYVVVQSNDYELRSNAIARPCCEDHKLSDIFKLATDTITHASKIIGKNIN